jgi:hypothetical protein
MNETVSRTVRFPEAVEYAKVVPFRKLEHISGGRPSGAKLERRLPGICGLTREGDLQSHARRGAGPLKKLQGAPARCNEDD